MHGPAFDFLASIEVFSGLDEQLLHSLASRLRKKSFRKGEHIFFQGDPVSQFYLVEMGKVEIYKSDLDGRRLTLWFIEPKGLFCLATLHAGAAFASALAAEDTMTYTLKKDELDAFVAQSGEAATRLVGCMARKMAVYSAMLEDMAFKGITARLAKTLAEYQHKDQATGQITCSLSQGELASLVGTCREVVARSLKKLREDGIVSNTRTRRIVIDRPEELKTFSG